ncbi:MAG TPA: histidinol-phosphate transaminase [Acidimicrobiia bacterium]|nr:histidinol-phosphate transaminase [Acidimicrobiia bacterium]
MTRATRTFAPVPPRDDLQALEGYHSPQLDVRVRLNTNESPFPPPRAFVDAWLAELGTVPLHRYPDRAARQLRVALAERLDQPVERVFCANGSNEVLQTLLLTYGGASRRALVFEPTYALHSHIARITGTPLVEAERRDDFSVDVDVARAAIAEHDPSLVFACSPNNPTGTVDEHGTIDALTSTLADTGRALLVVDEAYGEFAPRTAIDLVAEDRPLVVVRTYSKIWSMAALRLGFCVAPEWVVEELEKVVLPYHLGVPTQVAGRLALEYEEAMRARVDELVRERDRVQDALESQPGVTPFPSGANFVLFRVDGDGHAVWERLVARGVLVRDFARWPRLDDCLRVSIGTRDENDAFVAALRDAVAEEGLHR